MQCPNCKKENSPENSFCIFCGTVLPTPGIEQPAETVSDDKDVPPGDVKVLREEIGRLGKMISLMQERLVFLEHAQGIFTPWQESRPARPEAATPTPEAAVPATPSEVTPVPEARHPSEPVPTTPAAPPPRTTPGVTRWESPVSPAPPPPPKSRTPSAVEREWEQILGGSWLARIGVLAIIIGVGFFLKYAFDQNWLGPTARVIMGIVAGLAMLGGGHYWRKKYPTFAQAISGGGIALLYLSVFAAYSIFGLIGFYPAVALLLLISVGSALLALRYDAMALAILSIVGAFLAPFILSVAAGAASGTGGTVEAGQSFWLLAYVMVIDLGVLWLSTFRNWRWFILMALFGSLTVFGVWYYRFGDDVSLLSSMGGLTIIFLIFVAATTLYHIIWRRAARDFDYILMSVNATAYFGIGFGLMWNELPEWLGGFSLLIALFYGGLAYVLIRKSTENITLAFFSLGLALLFLTTAIPAQIGDRALTTITWAVQGSILIWLSLRFRMLLLRGFGYAVFVAMVIRLLFFDTALSIRDFTPVFNERFLAFAFGIGAIYLTGYLLWRARETLFEWEKKLGAIYPVFLIVANLLHLWMIGAEVVSYNFSSLTRQEGWTLILLIIPAGIITLYHIVWRRLPQPFDYALLIVNAASYIIISLIVWGDFQTWMGGPYFLIALIYGGLAYALIKRGADYYKLGMYALSVALVYLTVTIPVQFKDTAWTTIAWAAQGTILIWLSLRFRIPLLRIAGYIVFAVMSIRLLFFDTSLYLRDFTPVLNERFLAFVFGIATMYLAGYLLWREKDSLSAQEQAVWSVYPILFTAANLFTLVLFSTEVWDSFTKQLSTTTDWAARDGIRSARNLSLTALWAGYAVILLVVGINRRWRLVRLAALGLLIIPIVKVFVYDVFALEQVYRIIAFIGLGVLLLVSAYLYQRHSKTIMGFLTKE